MSALEATPTLTNGRWVKGRGGIRRWQEDTPSPHGRSIRNQRLIITAYHRGHLCNCGCLITPNEDCPNCRLWARQNEQQANLASFGRQP